MKFESPEQIEQSPEELPVGETIENAECKKVGDKYICLDSQGHIFMVEPGLGPQDNSEEFTGTIQVEAVVHDDEEETVYMAKYILPNS